jgi:hypothetical protein
MLRNPYIYGGRGRDVQLITCAPSLLLLFIIIIIRKLKKKTARIKGWAAREYLNCGKIFKHSKNAVVFKVSKLSDINQNIITFFLKYPILGVKAQDFKDFCFVAKKGHLTKEGLDLICQIKANMNTGRNLKD